MRKAGDAGKTASLSFDKLYIDGKMYTIDIIATSGFTLGCDSEQLSFFLWYVQGLRSKINDQCFINLISDCDVCLSAPNDVGAGVDSVA